MTSWYKKLKEIKKISSAKLRRTKKLKLNKAVDIFYITADFKLLIFFCVTRTYRKFKTIMKAPELLTQQDNQ